MECKMYEKRLLDKVLKEYTQDLPTILLEGTRVFGKFAIG